MSVRCRGTRSSYVAGCRCADCRAANSAYTSKWNREHPEVRKKVRTGVCPECSGPMSKGNGAGRDPERCLECERVRVAENLLPCGTRASYARGCRCPECKAAQRAVTAAMRASGRVPSHGLSGYTNYGCRCDVCRAAGSESNRRYRERAGAA